MNGVLFELRLKGKEDIARVFYCILMDRGICFLHSIMKKKQKTPLKELQLAKLRMKEVKKCYAKPMGTTTSVVGRLETGGGKKNHSPTLLTLRKYAQALDCDLQLRLIPHR